MIQVLQAAPRQKGTSEKLMQGLTLASQSIPELIGEYRKDRRQEQLDQMIGLGKKAEPTRPDLGVQPLSEDQQVDMLAKGIKEKYGRDITPQERDFFKLGIQNMPKQPQLQMQPPQQQQNSEFTPEQKRILAFERAKENPDIAGKLLEFEKMKVKEHQYGEAAKAESFKLHQPFIDDTTSQYKAFETDMKPRLLQMQELNKEELISPTAAQFLDKMHVDLGILENPSAELYDKVSQDLLKGLPETYGNRILQVEVQNFLKTIPRLVNSVEGRRMIASNMLKLGEFKQAYYDSMRRLQTDAIYNNQKLPRDFQQQVLENSMPQFERINKDFQQLAQVKEIPQGTVGFFNPQGGISFVPDNPDSLKWAESNGGRRIW